MLRGLEKPNRKLLPTTRARTNEHPHRVLIEKIQNSPVQNCTDATSCSL
jgi:hypothetical protein